MLPAVMGDDGRIPDRALVVRGGNVTRDQLREGCSEHEGVYGFSVQCEAGKTVAELASAGGLPHRSVGVSTVGHLRGLGHDVVRTRGRGLHATVVVPRDWAEADAAALAALFRPQPNPARR